MLNRTKTYPICTETFAMMGGNTLNKSNKNYVLSTINVDYTVYKKVYVSILLVVLIGLLKLNPVSAFMPVSVPLFNYIP